MWVLAVSVMKRHFSTIDAWRADRAKSLQSYDMGVVATDSLQPPDSLCELAPPSETAIIDRLRLVVSKLMLEEVSANDRGEDAAEHFRGITTQLYHATSPLGLIAWHPREVLQLQCWNDPETAYSDTPPSGQRGHAKRLVACAILLRDVGHLPDPKRRSEEENFVEAAPATLLRLTESALAMGDQWPHLTVRFLLWLWSAQPNPIIQAFAAFCILVLGVSDSYKSNEPLRDLNIRELCEWCIAIEARCRNVIGARAKSESWLIGLSGFEDRKGQRERWKKLAGSILSAKNSDGHRSPILAELADRITP